jgi:hypothetical protein
MKIEGNPKSQGPDARRFSARKAAPAEGGKSFGQALKKAAAALPGPAAADAEAAKAFPTPGAESAKSPADAPAADAAKGAKAAPSGEPVPFEDHMEMVKLRLKSGYYTGKNIDEALSDRLTGYFDELA